MGQNDLAMSSDPVFNNISSLMDPLNRVLPSHHALPDNHHGSAAREREAAEMDGISIDEMVRDLEQGFGVESLEDDSFGNAPHRAGIDYYGATEDDFSAIGVRNLEWRLPIIRSAAHRSADAIATNQIIDPSASREAQLTQIVLSTYRLIDPRFRGSYFQQVRVGRMLPMTLQTASCVDGTPPSLQPVLWNDHRNAVRLFGHDLPLQAAAQSPQSARLPQPFEPSQRFTKQPRLATKRASQGKRTDYRDEAIEVLAELQSRSHPAAWKGWLQGKRLVASLCGLLALCVLSVAAYRGMGPSRAPTDPPDQLASQLRLKLPELQQGVLPKAKSVTPRRLPPAAHSGEPAESDLDLKIPSPPLILDIPARELTTDELMKALAKASGLPENELEDIAEKGHRSGSEPRKIPQTRKPRPNDDLVSGARVGSSELKPPVVAESPRTKVAPPLKVAAPWEDAAVEGAVALLWSETDSASRRFTASTAAGLIDAWDLTADLAAVGSLEHAAAQRLIIQASWLLRPLARIVSLIRQSQQSASARFADASEPQLLETSHLDAAEIHLLITSWRAARKRVVRTNDLDQMLRQANVLLDRIVISDQLSPRDRSDSLDTFRVDVEQLARICSDKVSIGETNTLLAALDTLPAESEWARLASAEHPSGLMASIYCLQQRRWDEGIAWLGQTSNLAVAAAAKTEWKLIQNEQRGANVNDAKSRITLANRWSKIAHRLEPREAAAVRLHAIDLYGADPGTLAQRDELKAKLPLYVK